MKFKLLLISIVLTGFNFLSHADEIQRKQTQVRILHAFKEAKPKNSNANDRIDPNTKSNLESQIQEKFKQTCFEILKSPSKYDSKTIGECRKYEKEIKLDISHPKRASVKCSLKLPIMQKGCEGECCGIPTQPLRPSVATDLFEKPSSKSKVVGKITKDEALKNFELLLVTSELGEVKVVDDNFKITKLGLKEGDILKTISYGSEGSYIVCLGNSQSAELGWEGELELIKSAKIEQWSKITKKNGVTGYAPGIAYHEKPGCE
jgi:hypothetical protein